MATADSIFAEGVNNNNDEMQAIVNDDDIVTKINETPGGHEEIEQIAIEPESVEMVDRENGRENQGQSRLYSVDKVEEDNKRKIVSILVAVSIIYSVIISTVALIIALNNNNSSTSSMPSSSSSCDCTLNSLAAKTDETIFCNIIDICLDIPSISTSISPTISPTILPSISPSATNSPSTEPSTKPTYSPSMDPTKSPTLEPTIEPTLQPSDSPTYFDGYFIGDFKLSLKSSDHGLWRLCDGKRYRIDGEYSLLFQEIGFMFGAYNVTTSNVTYQYFQIPNISDSVVGIAGNKHLIGDEIGEETFSLTSNELPSHRHYTITWQECNNVGNPSWNGGDGYHAAISCSNTGITSNSDSNYRLSAHTNEPDSYYSSYTGNGKEFSLMQPTKYIGNLFIYTGVSI